MEIIDKAYINYYFKIKIVLRYCIGDIHGCIKSLEEIIDQIFKKDSSPEFYFVGDLIDRGPGSKEVLDLLFDLNTKGIKALSVRGNHEQMLLESYQNNLRIKDTIWKDNGAKQTILSFNKNPNLKLKVNKLIPLRYYTYINALPYYIELDNFYIVHAGINFEAPDPFSDFNQMVWTREEKYNIQKAKNKKIIHGHSPLYYNQLKNQTLDNHLNIINIDTGCVFTHIPNLGYLTALNMDNMEFISIKNKDIKH